jgi:chromosome partitioning protein
MFGLLSQIESKRAKMQVIVLASQKGGAGKTTLAAHLAVAAEAAGRGPVVMIDTDPQATLTKWWQQREADSPAMAEVPIADLAAKLGELGSTRFRIAIIDTPPAITASIRAVIGVADLVLLPVRPSPADLWAVGGTLDLCKHQGKQHVFVVTQATRGALLTVQAVAALSEHGTVCDAIIHGRVAYAGAFASGRAIQEVEPKGAGADEIARLLAFMLKRLQGSTQARKKGFVHVG